MRRSLEAFIVALAALSCVILQAQTPAPVRLETAPAAGIVDSVLVPAGTTLALELQDSLNTRYAKKGDRVSFKITSEVLIDGRVAIPRESSVDATIVAAKRAGLAQKGGEVQLALDRIVLPDGTSLPLSVKLARPGHWSRSDKIAPEGPSDRDGCRRRRRRYYRPPGDPAGARARARSASGHIVPGQAYDSINSSCGGCRQRASCPPQPTAAIASASD
jgi:hypothetical protein